MCLRYYTIIFIINRVKYYLIYMNSTVSTVGGFLVLSSFIQWQIINILVPTPSAFRYLRKVIILNFEHFLNITITKQQIDDECRNIIPKCILYNLNNLWEPRRLWTACEFLACMLEHSFVGPTNCLHTFHIIGPSLQT